MRRITPLALLFVFTALAFTYSRAQSPQDQESPKDAGTTASPGPAPAKPAAPLAPQPGDSTKLEILKSERARYPLQAEEKGIQGQVLLKFHISESGDVESVDVISGHPVLIPAAVDAAKKWKFKPYIRNGKPVKVAVNVPMDFAFIGNVIRDTRESSPSEPASASSTRSPIARTVASGIMSGRLIYKVAPVYPQEARANHVQGTVIMQASISKEGRITDLVVLSGPRDLRDSAVGAVQQWRYRPYMLNGEPVEVRTQIQVNYQLR